MDAALFSAYLRVNDKADADRLFVLSADLLSWRAHNTGANADEVKNHLAGQQQKIASALTAADAKRGPQKRIGRMLEAILSPDVADLVNIVAGRDRPPSIDKVVNRINGSQEQFNSPQFLYKLQTDTFAKVSERAKNDAAFREAWDEVIGKPAGVRAGATAQEMASSPELAAVLDVPKLLAAAGSAESVRDEVARQVAGQRSAIEAVRTESANLLHIVVHIHLPGSSETPDEKAAKAAEAAGKARQDKIDSAKAGLTGATEFAGLWLPEIPAKIGTVGKAAADIASAVSKFAEVAQIVGIVSAIGSLASVALTGNILGAATSIIGLFMGGPDSNALIMEELGKIHKDIAELRKDMTERFDRIDKALRETYDKIDAQLAEIKQSTRDIRETARAVSAQLSQLQAQMQTFGALTLKAIGDNERAPWLTAANGFVDYQATTGIPISPYEKYYEQAENALHTAATQLATDAAYVVPASQYPSADLNTVLNTHGPVGTIGYLSWYAKARFDHDFPAPDADTVGNVALWQLAANAYSKLSAQNPDFAGRLKRYRGEGVALMGQRILNASTAFSKPDPAKPLNPLFTGLTADYDNSVDELAGTVARQARDRVVADTRHSFRLFGPPTQPAPQGPESPEEMNPCYQAKRPLKKPLSITVSRLGPATTFARYINDGPEAHGLDYRQCWLPNLTNTRTAEDSQTIYKLGDLSMVVYSQVTAPDIGPVNLNRSEATMFRSFVYESIDKRTGTVVYHKDLQDALYEAWSPDDLLRNEFDRTATWFPIADSDAALARTMTKYLDGKRIEYYTRAIDQITTQQAARRTNDDLRLLQAYTELGFPRALQSDEQLRALLFGSKPLHGGDHLVEAFQQAAANVQNKKPVLEAQQQTENCPATDEAVDPVATCLQQTAHARMARLRDQYAQHFAELKAGTSVQTHPVLETTLRNVALVNNLVHWGQATDKQSAQNLIAEARKLWDDGKRREAAEKTLEGIDLAGEIAKIDPSYRRQFAEWAAYPAPNFLASADRYDDAQKTGDEAIALYKQLSTENPADDELTYRTANATMNLAQALSSKRELSPQVADYAVNAVDTIRALAAKNAKYKLQLGDWILYPTIDFLVNVASKPLATQLAQEAVDIFTTLNQQDPAKYGPKLAAAKKRLDDLQR
ncbi:hypothetical protein [Amycolatopsis sp. GA6-003]|uniref:hypothetical protein n=1 Tax=Amycolatopsis sp. GA6-003 TaxID=2652444 RepID=UPI0039174ADB